MPEGFLLARLKGAVLNNPVKCDFFLLPLSVFKTFEGMDCRWCDSTMSEVKVTTCAM